MYIATRQFRRENIDLLLNYGADINIHESDGDTAVDVTAALGRFDLVAHLLEKGTELQSAELGKKR